MRVLCAAAMIALLAGPAYAQQQKSIPKYGDAPTEKTPSEIEQERTNDKAYKRSLGNIPDQGPTDPWGNARSVDAPKAATKTVAKPSPAKPRTKTGATAN